ncbi:helix-turn-helix domain-containing protein [uncultured Megasphaera sp.]|uniref:helix-turn-helix domain-containing protein n=1 Tax=uncultured Megasphaera sp. TaxID=165188 RepID=UPI00261B66DC|nr:helix-turn-helix transcriptional regulator [uncultured Megasphaera sp.]
MKYYSRLKPLRLEAKMSQADVAKVLNCSQVGYGMYELGKRKLGKRKISVEKLMVLARLYHVSLDYLVGFTDEREGRKSWHDEDEYM